MSELSPRLGLPFLMAAQAQKHVTHNEALLRLDQVTQLVLQGLDATDPPVDPDEGQVWALGAAPTGAWAGQGGDLALWFDGGWLFVTPAPGWQAGFGTELRVFDGAAWVAPDLPALQNLPGVGVNASFDATNRLTVAAAATLLTHEGAGHQLKLNKATAADAASLLFQTGFSGRAEMGTAGNDDFAIKVSPDGAVWHDAVGVGRASGLVNLPNGLSVTGPLTLPAASVTRAALTNGTALSVIGRSANSAGAMADIAAGSDHQVMRRSGSVIGFGAVALNQSAAVTGQLQVANGGTGASNAASARTNLGLGTAATATITISATDTTSGRAMRVGDGGLLGIAPQITDFTADLPGSTGFYRALGDAPGIFPGVPSNNWVTVLGIRNEGNRRTFLGIHNSASRARTFFGHRLTATGAVLWAEAYDSTSLLGTVSQTAGVPTGAVIQRGSNANGESVRFADGTMICTHSVSASLAIDTAHLGGFRSTGQTWAYPAAFAAAPAVGVLARNLTAFGGISANTPGTGSMQWAVTAVTSQSAATREVALIAIGRWF